MKKILLILLISFLGRDLIGQAITKRAGASITPSDENLFIGKSFRVPVFTDTTAANLAVTLDSAGKLIFTYDVNGLWLRESNPKKWVEVGSGGGGGGGGSNTSIGAGFKIAVGVNATNIKSLRAGYAIIADSATTGEVKFTLDSATVYGVVRSTINDSIDANTISFRNPDSGDTLVTTPSAGVVLVKSFVTGFGTLSANVTDTTFGSAVDTATIYGAIRNEIRDSVAGKQDNITLTTTGISGVATLTGATLNIPNYSGGVEIGIIDSSTFRGTTLPADLTQTGFAFTQNDGLRASGGTTDFYANNIVTAKGSASMNFSQDIEFTLKTKPTANTEGLWLGRLSSNDFYRLSIEARPYWINSTTWTVGLYWVDGFTEKLIAVPQYSASITMGIDEKYRMEVSYNYPNVQAVFSRVDSTKSPYQDVIESVRVLYTYSGILSAQPIIANTGNYGFGVIGSSPAGVYYIDKFSTTLHDLTYPEITIPGNSIAAGYNSSSPEFKWTNRLFQNSLKRYTVFSGPSDRTSDMLTRLDELWLSNPGFLLWEVGWNDISSSVGSATFSANLSKLLDSAIAHGIQQAVLRLPQTAFGYDTAFVNVCNRKNVQLLDIGNLLDGNLDGTGIHPNDYGHQIIADFVKTKRPDIFAVPNPIQFDKNNNTLTKNVTSTTTTVDYINTYYISAASGNLQLNLFTTDGSFIGKKVHLHRTDNSTNTITVATFGGTTINGGSTLVVLPSQYSHVMLEQITSTGWVAQLVKPSQTVLPLDTTTYKIGVYNAAGDVYKMNWPTGGTNIGNSDLTQTGGNRTFTGAGQNLVFNGSGGTSLFNVEYNTIVLTAQNSGVNIQGDSILISANVGKVYIDSLPPSIDAIDSVVVITPTGQLKQKAQSDLVGGLLSGTYTPTLTNVANVAASTAYSCQYSRVGTVVTVSGEVDIDPTTTLTLTQLGISLPIASNLTATNELGGTSADDLNTAARVAGDATNDRAEIRMTPMDVTNRRFSFTFTYRIL